MKRIGMNDVRVIVVSSLAIYAVMAIAMGIIPGAVLSGTPPLAGVVPLTEQQARGRDVYVAEGCSYCHTQQVRPLAQDRVFGRPSARGDYTYNTPQLLGTERTGPDLTNIGARQPSNVWHLIHLYQPRALVAGSIMPAYPWLFKEKDNAEAGDVVVAVPGTFAPAHKTIVASARALDITAYLESLKQVALPAPPAP